MSLLQRLERRVLLNAVPDVSVDVVDEALIGETVDFEITFDLDDAAPGPGYGPFIDVILPRNGADGAAGTDIPDGIGTRDPVTFDFFGTPLNPVLDVTVDSTGTVLHPLLRNPDGTPTEVTGLTPGDRYIVLQLPLGSYEPTTIPLTVTGTANLSNLADVGVDLPIQVRGGFQFGCDPEDNPSTDNPNDTVSGFDSGFVTPEVLLINKVVNAEEGETATGPNFPKSYTINVDIADGQTVTDVEVSDPLSDRIVYLGNVALDGSSTDAGSGVIRQPEPPIDMGPQLGTELIIDYTSVLGVSQNDDLSVTFDFYVPQTDSTGNPIIDPMSGAPSMTQNSAKATYSWDPIDTRDDPVIDAMVEDPLDGSDQKLTNRSIAVQKSVSVVVDSNPGAADPAPGDILEYRIQFQISDYFDFTNVIVDDLLSNGQSFDPSFAPQLSITGNGGNVSQLADFNSNNYDNVVQSGTPFATDVVFRVSDELADRNLPGTVTGNENATPGTTGEIVYRAVVDDLFRPNGAQDPVDSVDEGDVLSNQVNIRGTVLKPDGSEGGTPTDGSAASISLPNGGVDKEVYAINGETMFDTTAAGPGDEVTYRIQYELPLTRFDSLVIKDTLPLPIFDSSTITTGTFDSILGMGAVPTGGEITYGPDAQEFFDLYYVGAGLEPTLSIGPGNAFELDFGSFSAIAPQSTTIDLLFTVEFQDFPFADGLILSNLVVSTQGSTNGGVKIDGELAPIISQTPQLNLKKGVVSTDTGQPPAVFTPTPVGPVNFEDPGSGSPAFTPSITSDGLDLFPIDSDLQNVDAGDLVKFAIVIENTGSRDGFDVVVSDTLPPGFVVPTTGPELNLQIASGDGTPLAFTDVDGNAITPGSEDEYFFVTGTDGRGVRIVDPADLGGDPLDGAIDGLPEGGATGTNVIVVTFDLLVDQSAVAGSQQIDTGVLESYRAVNNIGVDWTEGVDGPFSDDAIVTISTPIVEKRLLGTEIVNPVNANNEAVIGELVQYEITVIVPEGVSTNLNLLDSFGDFGDMAFVSFDSIVASSDLSTTLGDFSNVVESVTNNGQDVRFDLGTVTNTDTNNQQPETITLTVTGVVLNVVENQSGDQEVNAASATFDADGNTLQSPVALSEPVFVIEPDVDVIKEATVNGNPAPPGTGDGNDALSYTITIQHSTVSDTDAFELMLADRLPSEFISPVITSVVDSAGILDTGDFAINLGILQFAIGGVTANNEIDLELGREIVITLDGEISPLIIPGQQIVNTANIQWTSLDGEPDPIERSPFNPDSTERTGADGVGGRLNDYADSGTVIVNTIATNLSKSIVATSEAHTQFVNNNERLAIGEIVRYRLVSLFPEAQAEELFLRDLLPNGLSFLNDGTAKVAFVGNSSSTFTSTAFDTAVFQSQVFKMGDQTTVGSIVPTHVFEQDLLSAGSTDPNDKDFGPGVDPYFSLGTVNNVEDDLDQEFIVIEFNALVNNVIQNQTNRSRNNQYEALFKDQEGNALSNIVLARIVEPELNVEKELLNQPRDAGDEVVYSITLSNGSGARRADAFDIRLTDTLDSNLILTSIMVSDLTGVTDNSDLSMNLVDLTIDRLDVGQSIVVEVKATVVENVDAGRMIPNEAEVTYTSLPGPRGTVVNPTGSSLPAGPAGDPGAMDGERTGDGAPATGSLNNYFDSDTVRFTIETPEIEKFVDLTQYTIGELVDYELLVTLGEGITNDLVVLDDLPDGLEYVSFAVVTDPNANGGGRLDKPFNGMLPTPVPNAPVGSGADLVLDFGDTKTNDDNDPDNNSFVVLVQARVLNELGNQNGDTLTNTGEAKYTNPNNGQTDLDAGSVDITIIEPELNVDKQVTSPAAGVLPDAGDIIEYTVVIDHEAVSTSDAFDVMFRDMAPADTLITGVVSVTGTGLGPNPVPIAEISPDGTSIVLSNVAGSGEFDLPEGAQITLVYELTIQDSVGPGEMIVNEAMIQWSSLEGDVNSGDLRGERDGSGIPDASSVNDYFDIDQATVNVGGFLDLEKTVLPDVDPQEYTIGDTVRYQLEVGLFEGTTSDVLVVDDIPDVMTVDLSSVTVVAGNNFTFTPSTPMVDFTGGVLTVQIGDVVNQGDNDPTNDSFFIEYTALIVNDPNNVNGQVKTNTAVVTASNNLTDMDTASITIVEPFLAIDKTISDETPHLGETVTYQFAITHTGQSTTDAYDLIITDTLPPEVQVDTSSIVVDAPGGTAVTDDSTGNTIDIKIDGLELGETILVTFEAEVTDDIADYGKMFTNQVTLDWDNQPGINPEQRPDSSEDTAKATIVGPDLQIVKSTDETVLFPGDIFSYEIIVTNKTGPFEDVATGVTVVDILPEGLQFVESTSPFFVSNDPTLGTVTWVIGTMNPGESVSLDLTVQLDDPAPETEIICNEAVVTHDDIDPTPEDNIDDAKTPLDERILPDLTITKDDGRIQVFPGEVLTYEIVVTNVGRQDAAGVEVTDLFPKDILDFVSASDGGVYDSSTGIVTWNFAELDGNGGQITLQLTGQVKTTVSDPTIMEFTNFVEVKDNGELGPDPTPENNFDSDTDKVLFYGTDAFNDFLDDPHRELHRLSQVQRVSDPILSGTADPGTTLYLEIRDRTGQVIGWRSVVADAGGNYLALFQDVAMDQGVHQSSAQQTFAAQNHSASAGYNLRRYYEPAQAASSYFSEAISIDAVFRNRAGHVLHSMQTADERPLRLTDLDTLSAYHSRVASPLPAGQ